VKLPVSAHNSRPWRIHQIADDFQLEDVWALPTPGGPDDFPRLVQIATSMDPARSEFLAVRALFGLRGRIGGLFGWDDADRGVGSRVPTVRDRVPADLRDGSLPEFKVLPFLPLYLCKDEFAAEIANETMHGIMHLSWVPDGAGSYGGRMAVLVKPNGRLGAAYMAAIAPFRHLVVYPLMMRDIERDWRTSAAPRRTADSPI
jgi:Protein of unknown function (DUF2867)